MSRKSGALKPKICVFVVLVISGKNTSKPCRRKLLHALLCALGFV